MSNLFKNIKYALAVSLLTLAPQSAHAVTIFTTITTGNNDCSGVFGTAPDCNVVGPTGTPFSPLIAKFDVPNDNTDPLIFTQGIFGTIDGSEFSITGVTGASGTFTYTPVGDPALKYWVAKAGNDFNLFWNVSDAAANDISICGGADVYTDACLGVALVTTTANWSTPEDKELSHISFYDSNGTVGNNPPTVPLPAALPLFGTGLAIMGLVGWRRKRKAAA